MKIAIAGASVAGLAGAAALAARGHRIELLERDAAPIPSPRDIASSDLATDDWQRSGVPQMRHSHAFLAKLRNLLVDRAPDLLQELLNSGVREVGCLELVRPLFGECTLERGDEELSLLACRRTTFEWALRRYVERLPNVDVHTGARIVGLQADSIDTQRGTAHISGFRYHDAGESELTTESDLTIDATGRGTSIDAWLADLGLPPIECEREPCGIFYASRFYRRRPEAGPLRLPGGLMALDLGYLKVGLFPGDADTFSLTLAASPEDPAMRHLLRSEGFDAAARELPTVAGFIDASVAEPISKLHGMSGFEGFRRLPGPEPSITGFVQLGDALIHTNPLYGRGCTLSFVHAFALADALETANGESAAFSRELDAAVEREIVPWYQSARAQDRDARDVADELAAGRDPYRAHDADGRVQPRAYMRSLMRDGLGPAMREDIDLLRAFMRVFNLLDPPRDLLQDPSILQRVLASHAARGERAKETQGPDRTEMIAILEKLGPAADESAD